MDETQFRGKFRDLLSSHYGKALELFRDYGPKLSDEFAALVEEAVKHQEVKETLRLFDKGNQVAKDFARQKRRPKALQTFRLFEKRLAEQRTKLESSSLEWPEQKGKRTRSSARSRTVSILQTVS